MKYILKRVVEIRNWIHITLLIALGVATVFYIKIVCWDSLTPKLLESNASLFWTAVIICVFAIIFASAIFYMAFNSSEIEGSIFNPKRIII